MKKIYLFLSFMFILGLTSCDLFSEQDYLMEEKRMQDVNVQDAVEVKVVFNYVYQEGSYKEEYPETYYYDIEEEWSYIEFAYYYEDQSSLFYFFETVDMVSYLYEYEDTDLYYMETPNRVKVDNLVNNNDSDYMVLFDEVLDGVEKVEENGLDLYEKDVLISNLSEAFVGGLLYMLPPESYDNEITVKMYCHPTSEYCDYEVDLTNVVEYTVEGTFEDLTLKLEIVHTFYTEDNLIKEDIFPTTFNDDDYPNTISSMMMANNRVFLPHFEGAVDYLFDGDVFEFKVLEDGNYNVNVLSDSTPENGVYIYIFDYNFLIVYSGLLDDISESNPIELMEGENYVIIIESADDLDYMEYDFSFTKNN